MKIGYNLFVFECFGSYIHYTPKAAFPPGIAAFCFASQSIESPGIFGAERGMPVLEEDYLHKFASERFALASATERLSERSMRSEFARMADHQRANRNSKRNESSSSTDMPLSAPKIPGDSMLCDAKQKAAIPSGKAALGV